MHVKMYFSLHILVKSSFFSIYFVTKKTIESLTKKIQCFLRDLRKEAIFDFKNKNNNICNR